MARRRTRIKLDWEGGKVNEAMRSATAFAMREVTASAAMRARSLALRDTGTLAGSIRSGRTLESSGQLVGGFGWFSNMPRYALTQEFGPGGRRSRQSGVRREWRFRPYLRPAAKAEFGKVAERIAEHYQNDR